MTSDVISSTRSQTTTLVMVQWPFPDKPSLHRFASLRLCEDIEGRNCEVISGVADGLLLKAPVAKSVPSLRRLSSFAVTVVWFNFVYQTSKPIVP